MLDGVAVPRKVMQKYAAAVRCFVRSAIQRGDRTPSKCSVVFYPSVLLLPRVMRAKPRCKLRSVGRVGHAGLCIFRRNRSHLLAEGGREGGREGEGFLNFKLCRPTIDVIRVTQRVDECEGGREGDRTISGPFRSSLPSLLARSNYFIFNLLKTLLGMASSPHCRQFDKPPEIEVQTFRPVPSIRLLPEFWPRCPWAIVANRSLVGGPNLGN